MTPDKELCERLRASAVATSVSPKTAPEWEAATRIEALTKANAELVAEVERAKTVIRYLAEAYLHAKKCYHGSAGSTNPDHQAHEDLFKALNGRGARDRNADTTLRRFLEQKESDRG